MAKAKNNAKPFKVCLDSLNNLATMNDLEVKQEPVNHTFGVLRYTVTKSYSRKAIREAGPGTVGLHKVRDCETWASLTYNIEYETIEFIIKTRTPNWDYFCVTIDDKAFSNYNQIENIFRALSWGSELMVDSIIRGLERDYDNSVDNQLLASTDN